MTPMLIKMTDGGMIRYDDDCYSYGGCPTCNYGSEYINEIDIELTCYRVHIETNQMYEYALSEGQMMRLFLVNNNLIQTMTEKQFIDWLKEEISKIICNTDDYDVEWVEDVLKKFEVNEK